MSLVVRQPKNSQMERSGQRSSTVWMMLRIGAMPQPPPTQMISTFGSSLRWNSPNGPVSVTGSPAFRLWM